MPKRPCRFCTVKFEDLDKPHVQCKLIRMSDIQKITENLESVDEEKQEAARSTLRKLSLHESMNAFRGILFGSNNHGIVQACAPDIMHLLELGLIAYVLTVFVQSMTNAVRAAMDELVDASFEIRSSVKATHLRMNFARGSTSITLLTAKEWPGLMMAYLVILKSSPETFVKSFCPDDMESTPIPANETYPHDVASLHSFFPFPTTTILTLTTKATHLWRLM